MTLPLTIIIAASVVCIATTGAMAQATVTSPPGKPQQATAVLSDSDFVEKATIGNRFEVEAGQLAATKATDAKLKDFGRMMVTDHGAALRNSRTQPVRPAPHR